MIEIELERTFLLKTLPSGLLEAPFKDMVDIYIPSTAGHPTLRIRKNGSKCVITKKEPLSEDDRSRQQENTIPLREDEYAELSLLPGKRIEKRRYAYSENGYTYEVDVFGGGLQGLVLADIEFESEEKMSAYSPPSWVLAEVTQEKFIAGGELSGKSYEDIANTLSRFGYKKL